MGALLEVKNLSVEFSTRDGVVKAVRNLNYSIDAGEVLGIIGESGSGKSVNMLAVLGLLAGNGRVTGGEILFEGVDISPLADRYSRKKKLYSRDINGIRGKQIAMIFQDPMSYLNPIIRVGTQITEGLIRHKCCARQEAKKRAIELMEQVGIPSPGERFHQYPFEFSGGMRQRIIIAIALSCAPKLIIADEPTTALDVTVQAQIIDLLKDISEKQGTAILMITHDLGVVAKMCNRINIMYAGDIIESGTTDQIFYNPCHPYTRGLLNSVGTHARTGRQSLLSIPGSPPDLLKLNNGCAFMPRCTKAMNICKDYMPDVTRFDSTQYCRCWEYCRESADKIIGKTGRSA